MVEVRAMVPHWMAFDECGSEPCDVLGIGVWRWHGDKRPNIIVLCRVVRKANKRHDVDLARGGRFNIDGDGGAMVRPMFLDKRKAESLTEEIGDMNGLVVQSFSTRAMKFRSIVIIEIRRNDGGESGIFLVGLC